MCIITVLSGNGDGRQSETVGTTDGTNDRCEHHFTVKSRLDMTGIDIEMNQELPFTTTDINL